MKSGNVLLNEMAFDSSSKEVISFWISFKKLCPHLIKETMKYGAETKIRRKVTEYLISKKMFIGDGLSRSFVDKSYGFRRGTGTYFNSYQDAKRFFIEAGFLNEDGKELEYEH